jgi:hypothetical protein
MVAVLAAGIAVAYPAGSSPAAGAAGHDGAWRTLTYAGERFSVPASWPVRNLGAEPSTCLRFDRHAVYEGRGATSSSCPPMLAGVTEALQIEPLDTLGQAQAGPDLRLTRIGGQVAEVNTDQAVTQRLTAAFPTAGILVTVSYGADRATAERVLSSFAPAAAGSSTAGRAAPSAVPAGTAAAAASTNTATTNTATTPTGATPSAAAGAAVAGPTIFTGEGFDSCSAPSPAALAAWRQSSPYKALGIYIGGVNRACGDGYLSASWVNAEVAIGWKLFPLYVGPQASCADQGGLVGIPAVPAAAAAQGVAAATDAAAQMAYFGMGAGTPIYYDMESWNTANPACSADVVTFVKAWSIQLEHEGYVPGIYGSADGGIAQDIAPLYGQPGGPLVIDVADWDNGSNTDIPYLSNSVWPEHQRIKQFHGGVAATFGGVTIDIDQDYADSTLVGGFLNPVVDAVSPDDAVVGTTVTITGHYFVKRRTTVSFGGVAATDVVVISPSELTARVPVRSLGTVDVTVSTIGGTSLTTPADQFALDPIVGAASAGTSGGYWLAAGAGQVMNFGAVWRGSKPGAPSPTVGVAADAATGGYWTVTAAGNVNNFDAPFYGSPAHQKLAGPVVGITADPATGGYWVVTSNGSVYNYDAPFYGSLARHALAAPVVGITADPATGGYWLATANGGVDPFHAPFYGSLARHTLPAPVVGIATDPATDGYWLVTANGGVDPFHAAFYGSLARHTLPAPIVSITATATGYLLVSGVGSVAAYHTPWLGSLTVPFG